MVRLGLDGHRDGFTFGRADGRRRVRQAIRAVGASAYADAPVGLLSGGEQQRLRIAQALVGDPHLLLCDEPLLSLDFSNQTRVGRLLDQRRQAGAAIVFVTHELNPVLPAVDRVLYLVDGRWAAGTPRDILTPRRLSKLYGTPVDVLKVRGRTIVMGAGEEAVSEIGGHHHHPPAHHRRHR